MAGSSPQRRRRRHHHHSGRGDECRGQVRSTSYLCHCVFHTQVILPMTFLRYELAIEIGWCILTSLLPLNILSEEES